MHENAEDQGGRLAIGVVWAIALVGSGLVVALAYGGTDEWFGESSVLGVYGALGVVLALCVVGALAAQLATRRPPGFVVRASASIGGAVVAVALAALAVLPTLG